MRKAWGNTRRSILLSAALSGLFFACLHFFNLLVHPFPVVFLQVLSLILTGFYYAMFAIYGGSIWPAVVFHWVTNATITLALTNIPDFSESITNWISYAVIAVVPVLISLLLLDQSAERSSRLDSDFATEAQVIE
jgi:membrane protease YdiL (CAAX protease family)